MKRNKVELKKGRLLINGEPFFIYSGEIHYFRIPKDKWQDRLKRAKETGLNTISTYIPWSWHETQEGKFDFNGKTSPERDLLHFIKLVSNMGFFLIARVGPVSNAEIKGEGIPPYLLENYQVARAKDRKGANALHEAMVSYMNPVFREHVSKWYSKLLPIIGKNTARKGGPIIMVQLDNEIGMMNWVMDSADYNESTTRLYCRYLEGLYKGDLSLLNDKYYTNYTSFDEISQPKGSVDEEGVVRCWDWVRFYRDFYARYYSSLAEEARGKKINVPFMANIPMFWDYNLCARAEQGLMTILQFRDFTKFTPNIVFGGAYQIRNLNFDNFHDIILMTEGVKMIGDGVSPRVCVETQVGGMNDRPRIYPSDINLLLRCAVGHGLDGLNSYMFCGGTNPPGFGLRGTYHEWQSPVTSRGKRTSRIKPLEEMGAVLRTFGPEITETNKKYDFTIGFYAPYYETAYLKGSVIDQMRTARDKFFFDGIARLLTLNGFNYDLLDIERAGEKDMDEVPAMWVFALDYMDKRTQSKLVDYVKKGGTLIISPTLPTKNMGLLREDTLLKEFEIDISEVLNEDLVFISGRDYTVSGGVKVFNSKKRRVVARTKEKKPCGILKKVKKGRVMALGFGVTHLLDYHIDLISHFMQLLDIKPALSVSARDVHAVVRSNKKHGFISLCNFNDEPREVSLNLRIPGMNKTVGIPQEGAILLPNRSAYILPINVSVSRRARIRYSTAEILGAKCDEKELRLDFHGASGGRGEIFVELRRPRSVALDGREIPFKHKDGVLKLSFTLTGRPQNLIIL